MEIHRIYSHDQSNTEKSTYQGGHCSTPRDRVSSRKATISDCRFLEFFQYIVQANHHWLSYTDDDCSSEWRLDDGFLGSPEKFHGHRHISIDIFSDWGDIPKYIYIYIILSYIDGEKTMKHRAMFHGSPWPGEDHLRRTETSFTMSPGMPRQWRQKSPGSRYTSCIDINIQILYWLWILGYTMIYYDILSFFHTHYWYC